MGDRARIVFWDGSDGVSSAVYTHWGSEIVPAMLEKHKDFMKDRFNDIEYACARFVGMMHVYSSDRNTGLGIGACKDLETAKSYDFSPGDGGTVIVDVRDFSWKAYHGYHVDYGKNKCPHCDEVID